MIHKCCVCADHARGAYTRDSCYETTERGGLPYFMALVLAILLILSIHWFFVVQGVAGPSVMIQEQPVHPVLAAGPILGELQTFDASASASLALDQSCPTRQVCLITVLSAIFPYCICCRARWC